MLSASAPRPRRGLLGNETSSWKPDDARRGTIVRQGRIQDSEGDLSEFPHVILNQARVHDLYLDVMRNAPTRMVPDYARRLTRPTLSPNGSYPVTASLERLGPEDAGQIDTVKARFVVGCDGARSVVRKAIGRTLCRDSANQAWGVMDVLAVTDFPYIRLKATLHSAKEGSVLIIPREGGYLVRLYIELDRVNPGERISNRSVTGERLISAARRILHPHTLDVKEVAWWSVFGMASGCATG